MTLTLPIWGWIGISLAILFSWFMAYGCGSVNGEVWGIDRMKREAIRHGLAKACDFDGGWRWWTRQEIARGVTQPNQGGEG